MRKKLIKNTAAILLSAALSLALSACQSPYDSTAPYETIRGQCLKQELSITGRIGVITPDDKVGLRFKLQKDRQIKSLYLISPVGHTIAFVYISPSFVRLKTSDMQKDSTSLKELLLSTFGISLPDDNILALLCGAYDHAEPDANGYPATAAIDSYLITYAGYKQRQSLILPKYVNVKGDGYTLKIAIDD